jgi:hypothetical protein
MAQESNSKRIRQAFLRAPRNSKDSRETIMSQTASWTERIREELVGTILPFWMRYAVDRQNGGFYGTVDRNLNVEKESER